MCISTKPPSTWQKMSKAWSDLDEAVIGAISETRGLTHCHIILESNNVDHFEVFLLAEEKVRGQEDSADPRQSKAPLPKKLTYLQQRLQSHVPAALLQSSEPHRETLGPPEAQMAEKLLLYVEETRSENQRTKMTITKLRHMVKERVYL